MLRPCPQCGNPSMLQKDREAECQFCGFKQCEECNDSYREVQDNKGDLVETQYGSR